MTVSFKARQRILTSQNNMALLCLDSTLAKAHQVGANAHRAAGHQGQRKVLAVGSRSFTGDFARATQILDTQALAE